MGKLLKRVGRRPTAQRLVGATVAALIALVRRTTRWRTVFSSQDAETRARAAWAGEQPMIVAFWHNRLTMMPYCWPSEAPFHMLISAHRDGQLIARTVKHFGIETVAGSSTRGGSEALRALVRLIKTGVSVGITPDGPRGPRMHASDGAIALARLSGAPILPAAVSVGPRVVMNTWDRLIVALPFGEGAMVWGAPIFVTAESDFGAMRELLERELTWVSAEADRLVGHTPIAPAEAPTDLANART